MISSLSTLKSLSRHGTRALLQVAAYNGIEVRHVAVLVRHVAVLSAPIVDINAHQVALEAVLEPEGWVN